MKFICKLFNHSYRYYQLSTSPSTTLRICKHCGKIESLELNNCWTDSVFDYMYVKQDGYTYCRYNKMGIRIIEKNIPQREFYTGGIQKYVWTNLVQYNKKYAKKEFEK